MTFLRTDPIAGKSRGTVDQAMKYAQSRGALRQTELRVYLNELYKFCDFAGFDFAILFAQACDETGTFTSALWRDHLNPSGIGALETLDRPNDVTYVGGEFTAASAAWAHTMHMFAYVYGDVPASHPLAPYKKYDPRFNAVLSEGYGGKAKTLSYLDGRWAANTNYSAQIVAHAINAFGNVSYQPRTPSIPKEPVMTMKAVRFVGLNLDVWLPADIVVEIAIVPSWRTNIRSNEIFSGQTSYTQHETANFNYGANADMHKRWLHGGAGGASVGFNFVVDDKKIIQLTPLNEVTWAAGTTSGNRYSYHTELCVNSDINHIIARKNAAALAGGILAAKGWGRTALVQHNIWWGKDCPYLLRREGRWTPFVDQAVSFATQAKNAATGTVTPPAANFRMGTVVKTTANYYLRNAPAIRPDTYVTTLPAGTQGTVIGGPVTADNHTWWDIKGTFGTGFVAQAGLEKVSDPVTPLVFDGSQTMTINGIVHNASKRTVTAATGGVNERQWADTSVPALKVHPAGSKIAVLGWLNGADISGEKRWWIVRPDGGRIWVGGTVEKP